jgi:hypothetical protein
MQIRKVAYEKKIIGLRLFFLFSLCAADPTAARVPEEAAGGYGG